MARPESGRPELFVRLLEGGESVRVSENGAWVARFDLDGEMLYFTTSDRRLASVSIAAGSSLAIGAPVVRFELSALGWTDFAVLPDGPFLALVREIDGSLAPLTVMTGWNASRETS